MKESVATAAATALTVVSSLLSILPPPQIAAPALVAFSIPYQADAVTALEPLENSQGEALQEALDVRAIKDLIRVYAVAYDVNPGIMEFVVDCETGHTFDPKQQSFATYKRDRPEYGVKKGDRELSFGLAQIHLPANPTITRAQAEDPDFALQFLAKGLNAGEYWRWSCLVK